MRTRLVAARPNRLDFERRDGYLITPPRDFARLYKSPEALMAWARAGCPDYDERHPPTLTFDTIEQFRIFALKENWGELAIERVIEWARCLVLVLPTGTADAGAGGCINLQQFLNSGTWVIPSETVNNAFVQGCGGGGGGGGGGQQTSSATNSIVGAGGGGGALLGSLTLPLVNVPNSLMAVTIGAGGNGGGGNAGGGNSPTPGGDGKPGSVTTFVGGVCKAGFPGASGGGGGGNTTPGTVVTTQQGRGGASTTANGANQFPIQFTRQLTTQGYSQQGLNGAQPGAGGNGFNFQAQFPFSPNTAGNGADNPTAGNYTGGAGGASAGVGAAGSGGGGGGGGCGPFGSGGAGGAATAVSNGNGGIGASAATNSGAGGGGGASGSSGGTTNHGGNGGNGGSGVLQVFW